MVVIPNCRYIIYRDYDYFLKSSVIRAIKNHLHVNDSGFWMVGKYLYLTEKQTIQTWTVASTIISISGIVMILIVNLFL